MVVISTDLSHFYKKTDAAKLDTNMLDMIQNLDPTGVLRSELDGTGFACGAGAVIAGIKYAILAGAKKGVLLKYSTSGEITGDDSSVVGYGAVALGKNMINLLRILLLLLLVAMNAFFVAVEYAAIASGEPSSRCLLKVNSQHPES